MKRRVFLVALCLLFAFPLLAGDIGEPNRFYAPAHIGLYLPDDAEVEEEEGVWCAYSESAELEVTFQEADAYLAPKDIGEQALLAVFAEAGIEDFTYLNTTTIESVTFAYGQGRAKDEEGNEFEGFFGILTNTDVKKKTFIFSVIAPSLAVEKSGAPAQKLLDYIPSVDAP